MGQYFTIVNIDKRVCMASLGKFGEFFPEGYECDCITALISSAGVKFPKDPMEGQPYIEARKYNSSQTGICDLPCELHNEIFAELRDPLDVFALCLTASHFWRVGLSHYKALYMDYVRHAHDWSGDRLICVGSYGEDLPEGLINDEEFEKLKATYLASHSETSTIYAMLSECSQSFPELRWPTVHEFYRRCELETRNPLSRRHQKWLKECGISLEDDGPSNDLPEFLPLYKYDFSAWLHLSNTLETYDLEMPGPYVLRNLSKKVYVRQDALALKSDGDATVYHMLLGSLVLARIAWSSYPLMAMAYATDHDLHRGAWAGDRFDVVDIEAIEHDDGWTDVSPAAKKELSEIWESEFGSGWENTVRKRGL